MLDFIFLKIPNPKSQDPKKVKNKNSKMLTF